MTNNVSKDINCNIISFADDTRLYSAINSPADCDSLQCDLSNVYKWAESKNMQFNSKKFQYINFTDDDVCERALRIFLKVQLKIPDAVADEMQFVRCHRMGPKYRRNPRGNQRDRRRPVIVHFHNFKDKSVVWAGKSNLTDSRYSVNENFSRDTEYNRRKLFAIYKKAKNMDNYKKKVSLNGDVLIIDSVRYNADSLHMLPKGI